MMYVASKHNKVLCHESCYHVKKIADENKIRFNNLEEGLKVCKRVCKTCKGLPWKRNSRTSVRAT